MNAVPTLLVIMSLAAFGNATFNFLKPKVRVAALVQPVARYRSVRYLAPPVPAPYSPPVSTVSAHVSAYSTSLPPHPPVATYGVPAPYGVPAAHVSAFAAPVPLQARPAPAVYSGASVVTYQAPEVAYVKSFPGLTEQLLDDCNYGESYELYK